MYNIRYTNRFKKDYKLCKKRGLDIALLKQTISILEATGTLPPEYKPHPLKGKYQGYMECHIQVLPAQSNTGKLLPPPLSPLPRRSLFSY